eukprot:3078051-Amphidinium_carterae.1
MALHAPSNVGQLCSQETLCRMKSIGHILHWQQCGVDSFLGVDCVVMQHTCRIHYDYYPSSTRINKDARRRGQIEESIFLEGRRARGHRASSS